MAVIAGVIGIAIVATVIVVAVVTAIVAGVHDSLSDDDM